MEDVQTVKSRCDWAHMSEEMMAYHDNEWGTPCHDDGRLFEALVLDSFQCGLSWAIILKKREAFRRAFDGFDAKKIAGYGEDKVQALLDDPGIVRAVGKIRATITNARVFLAIQDEFGSFSNYLWSFTDGQVVVNTDDKIPTRSALSEAVSSDLRKRGMRYVGPTTTYAYLEGVGVINDHVLSCYRHGELTAKSSGL